MALCLALGAAVLLLASGQGVRFDAWSYRLGLGLMLASKWPAWLAAALALIGLLLRPVRAHRAAVLATALAVALAVSWVPFEFGRRARSVPHIHDITTDVVDPPQFVALLAARNASPNGAAYGGREIADQQRAAYPDIVPLVSPLAPEAAFAGVREAAQALEWDITAADPAAGRLEAVATTFWFGFKDDVVVRVVPWATGSRIDVRSVSRVGRSDLGTNAERIRAFLARVKSHWSASVVG